MITSYLWIGTVILIIGLVIIFLRDYISRFIYPPKLNDVKIPGMGKVQMPDKITQEKIADMSQYLFIAGLIIATVGFILFFLGEFNIKLF